MAERNVSEIKKQFAESAYQLPGKIEQRLAELVQMGEFDQADIAHCRSTYWSARDDWHNILFDCYDMAKRRLAHGSGEGTTGASA